ncbi:MAG: Hsp20/alpha crystallin family protein [Bacteroidia bacterium]|nr:Hsp20/alpha crystallin family protein [Bacteroidia bacterium]
MFNLKIMEDKAMLPTIMRRSFRPFYMPNFFDDDFLPVLSNRTSSMPAVNIKEDEKNYVLDLAIPGMDKKDLKIDINEDVLTISSETKNETSEERDGYKKKEFNYSSFCRSFYIPDNVNRDKIEANYKDGILTVALPKMEEEKKNLSRQVSIS